MRGHAIRRGLGRAGLILCCGWALAAGAQGKCPGGPDEPVPASISELNRLDADLAQHADACARDAPFLAYRGAVLLALGRPVEAASMLELSLLLAPDVPVTQIDYARALTQLGEAISAASIWRSLLGRADLPPHLRPEIESRLASLARIPAESTAWRQRREVSLRAGYDSNLNSASSLRELTLLFPDVGITLPIAPAAQPVDGGAAWLDGRWQAARVFAGERELELRGELRLRGAFDTPGVGYRTVDLEATGHQRIAGGVWSASVGVNDVLFGGEHLYRALRSSLQRTWAGDLCAHRAGADLEWRQYPVSRALDGRYAGLGAGLACGLPSGPVVGLTLRAGLDDPIHTRPGGAQIRSEARLQASYPWQGGTFQGLLGWQGERDRDGYSPLLAGGIPRSVRRLTLSLEWSRPINTNWLGTVAAEAVEQRANLPLFELRGVSIQAGVKRVW